MVFLRKRAALCGILGATSLVAASAQQLARRAQPQPPSQAQQTVDAAQHEQRAQEYLRTRQPQLARKELEFVVAAQPGNTNAQANLGVLLYFAKQFAPAVEHLRAALTQQTELPKIRGLLGLSELALGQRETARTDLAAALPGLTEPAFAKQVGLTLMELETAAGDRVQAVLVGQTLRAQLPGDPEVLYACYRTSTDLAGASLLDLSLAAPQSAQMQQAIAHELLRVRDLPGAIAAFRRALAIDASLPGIHFELAEALHASPALTERAEAEQQYRLALQSDPNNAGAKVRLADLLGDKGDWTESRRLYESALAANSDNESATLGLARADSETGHDAEAVKLLERAVAEDPSDMLAHFRLSGVYRKLQRPADARREIAEYTRLKQVKEKLRDVYSNMKLTPPGATQNAAPDAATEPK